MVCGRLRRPHTIRKNILLMHRPSTIPRHRAISPQQKSERREQILAAAGRLFAAADFDSISMLDVAREAGLAKGTLYLYFQTKEQLFLALLADGLAGWFAHLEQALQAAPTPLPALAFTRLLEESLRERLQALRLLGILHAVLERNLELQAALDFKLSLTAGIQHTGSLIEQHLTFLQPGQGALLLRRMYAILVGLQNLASPAPSVRAALQQPGLELWQVELLPEFTAVLNLYLYGQVTLYRRSIRE